MALTQEAIPTTNNPTWNAVQIVPGSSGYRLPTEAQWEFAAKGGQAQSSFTFSGSDTVAAVAWHDANSEGMTREVGRLAANQLGIHDMSGNLWEWVWDWYDQYPGTNQTDPTGAISGAYRVARGGGWSSAANTTRLVFRNPLPPTNLNRYIGFRVSRP
jgi:formylglycine-generating enzyme required for sulfatase activity